MELTQEVFDEVSKAGKDLPFQKWLEANMETNEKVKRFFELFPIRTHLRSAAEWNVITYELYQQFKKEYNPPPVQDGGFGNA
jgi:hypothetical protein